MIFRFTFDNRGFLTYNIEYNVMKPTVSQIK